MSYYNIIYTTKKKNEVWIVQQRKQDLEVSCRLSVRVPGVELEQLLHVPWWWPARERLRAGGVERKIESGR